MQESGLGGFSDTPLYCSAVARGGDNSDEDIHYDDDCLNLFAPPRPAARSITKKRRGSESPPVLAVETTQV